MARKGHEEHSILDTQSGPRFELAAQPYEHVFELASSAYHATLALSSSSIDPTGGSWSIVILTPWWFPRKG